MPKLTESAPVRQARQAAGEVVKSPLLRAYTRYKVQRGSRLAAAMSYTAFLSLFPLLAVAVAITSAVLGDSGVQHLKSEFQQNLPGLSDKFSLDSIVSQAATVGVISGVLLIWSGLSWVNTARGSLRAVWNVPDNPGKAATRKAADLASLVGLGLTAAVSLAATAASASAAATVLRWLGIDNAWPARDLLRLLGVLVGLAASTALYAYLLAGIPRLVIPRRVLLYASIAGAVVLEITKGLIASYLSNVAGKSLYGAFGVPVAVLIWLNITFQMLLFLSAWTATRTEDLLAHAASIETAPEGTSALDE
ncbi:MAG TPA: YihY/virulence factor BrkB family protein [Actinocrinis sp.]|nr:YihY/virulence factor BrkB family protein [Actinocrinis sp.]